MIKNILLKFGKAPNVPPELIETEIAPTTVFVGPNNSGKSKVLSEIYSFCARGSIDAADLILQRIEFEALPLQEAERRISNVTLKPMIGEVVQPNYIFIGKRGSRHHIDAQQLKSVLQDPTTGLGFFCTYYLSFNSLMLNGQNRINLTNQQSAGDLLQEPQSSFQVLFRDDAKRLEVRRIIYEAFNFYFVISPMESGTFKIRLSKTAPPSHSVERSLDDEAVKFHSQALPIETASDGVKAFTGMITEIIAGDPDILFIDEPEAFLHPALSNKLGQEVSRAITKSGKRLFVSTHSPNFVMGCIQSKAPLNIVRLTYRDDVATARILPNSDILKLMRNPLLRSTGVLNGLFYEFVVVTESDTDRAFYQEINERLLQHKPELGIPNCLFINAQNKQTERLIIKPLRELGIPTVGIVDVDVFKEGGSVWSDFLSSGFVPELEKESLAVFRNTINARLRSTEQNMKTAGGISLLTGPEHEAASNLCERLNDYGLFVVRGGELESWLKDLGATGHGPNWLTEIFEKMGEDPASSTYLQPSEGDVWAFMGSVKDWLTNPKKKGIPS